MNKEALRDALEFGILFLTAITEMLMIMFYSVFDNKLIINVLLVIIPVIFCAIFYVKYRKSHYQQVYSKEELKKQGRL